MTAGYIQQAFQERQDRLGHQAHGRRLFDDAMKRCAFCQERRRKVLTAPNGAKICKPCGAKVSDVDPSKLEDFSPGETPPCTWCGSTGREWIYMPNDPAPPFCCDVCCEKAAAL